MLSVASPGLTVAAESAPDAKTNQVIRVTDVALDQDGGLVGQVVTLQGAPASKARVLLDDGRQQWSAATDAEGKFRFDGLRGGGYRVQSGGQVQFCRAWKDGTAPPAANRGLMLVQGRQTILGQYCGSPVQCGSPVCGMPDCRQILTSPLFAAGVVAAAIAIPIAIHNADDDDDPAS
jgi:hypothetical protein